MAKTIIYLEDAIEALRTCYDTETITYTNGNEYIDYDQALDLINALPSAQSERKKGEWIKVDPHIVVCPFCKHASSPKNFCADCGADLMGGNNE